MKYALRSIAVLAITSVVLGICMWRTGFGLAVQQERDHGVAPISTNSKILAAVYAQRVGNDPQSLGRALAILSFAGQSQRAERLRTFFANCNVQRFFGQEDACTRETVRSAVDHPGPPQGLGYAPIALPLTGQLASEVNQSLSVSLATQDLIRQATTTDPGFWGYNKYGGPGLVFHEAAGIRLYVIIAARNRSPWDIKFFRVRFALPSAAGAPLVFDCDQTDYELQMPNPIVPGGQAVERCIWSNELKDDEVVRAVQAAQHHGPLSAWVEWLALENPHVLVANPDVTYEATEKYGPTAPLQVSPEEPSDYEFYGLESHPSIYDRVVTELKGTSCHELGNCQSPFEAASLALFHLSLRTATLMWVVAGLLLGIGWGALVRRSFLFGSVPAGIALAAAVAVIGYLIYGISRTHDESAGFAGLAVVGLVSWFVHLLVPSVVAFFVGIGIIRPLRRLAEPAP
ncbi:MAG: hypothetical protein ACTHMO_01355 [Rhodanobacteraceae bacterium]